MRQFRHLTRAEISNIIVSFNNGEAQASIARRFNVDHSTINYHVGKYQKAYPEDGSVYALVQVDIRKTCMHPSGKCTLCGEMWDMLNRTEREEIERLTRELARAKDTLRTAGFVE